MPSAIVDLWLQNFETPVAAQLEMLHQLSGEEMLEQRFAVR